MPDLIYISLAIGVMGVILAFAALISLRRMRREQTKTKLSSRLTWVTVEGLPTGTIRLDIWNAGNAPVMVRKIQLVWQDTDTPDHDTGSIGFAPYDVHSKTLCKTVTGHSLQPCEGRSFVLPPLPPAMMKAPAELPEDKVWISLQGESAEVSRITGDLVKPLLEKYLETSPNPTFAGRGAGNT